VPLAFSYPGPPTHVQFLERPNRYLSWVSRGPRTDRFAAHVPNPGRMEELLVPAETQGYVIPNSNPRRKTAWDLVSVRAGRTLVSIDSRVANPLVGRALHAGRLPEVGPGPWTPEPRYENGRMDFGWTDGLRTTPLGLIEVKSSSLRVGRVALFPDAPTERGTRHALGLRRAARRGVRCSVVFVIHRPDVDECQPNSALDPAFARALTSAHKAGVRILAQTLHVRPSRLDWGHRVPVRLSPSSERI
jgi:sugar fermentation stimulation protein A